MPFVPTIWHVGRLYVGRWERRRRIRLKLRSIDITETKWTVGRRQDHWNWRHIKKRNE